MEGVIALLLLIFGIQWAKKGFPGIRFEGKSNTPQHAAREPRMAPDVHKAALEAYKHAVSEKMDVMRAAIQMGWSDSELKRLDTRLEELIGKDELKRLLDGEVPQAINSEAELDPEAERIRLRSAASNS